MNIFDIYLEKIIKILEIVKKNKTITVPENLNGVKVDIPPAQFDCDISTNVSMVLAKINEIKPIDLAKKFTELIKKEDTDQQRSQHDQFWKLIQLQKKMGIHQSESCEFLCINHIKLGCIKNGIQHFLITCIDAVEFEFKDVVFFRTLPGP